MRQLLVHEQDRRGHGSSHRRQAVILSRSRDFDPRRVDHSFVTPSGCGRHCATPFYDGFDAVLAIASPRSPGIGRLPETVNQPIVLRDGFTQWADSLLQGFRVPLPAPQFDLHIFLKNMVVGTSVHEALLDPSAIEGIRRPMAGSAACCTPYLRCCPFFPVHSHPTELPATTEEGPKCRESGHLAADTTKSSGSLRSSQTTPSHRTTCRETREACGLTSEPLARQAGKSAEITGFTCEEILGIQSTASKGSEPRTAPRS